MAASIAGGVAIEPAQADLDADEGWHADFRALDAGEQQAARNAIGSPGVLTAKAQLAALGPFGEWRDQIVTTVLGSNEETLAANLDAWAAKAVSDDALLESHVAGAIYQSSLQSNMGAQLMVRQIEAPEAGGQRANAVTPNDSPYFDMPFERAIEVFLARGVITPEEFAQLSNEARSRAFTATRMSSAVLIQRCRDLLASSLQNGSAYQDFAQGIRDESLTLGIEPSSPAYLETVFRTNIAAAYGAGRLSQIRSPAVIAARPFVQFRATMDSRTRDEHADLNGMVFRQSSDWTKFAPPLDFNCRCVCVSRRADQVNEGQVTDPSTIDFTPRFHQAATLDLPASVE